jgi:hypothetical protein
VRVTHGEACSRRTRAAARSPGGGRRGVGDDEWAPVVSGCGRRRGAAGGHGPAELGQVGREAALARAGLKGWRRRAAARVGLQRGCWAGGLNG